MGDKRKTHKAPAKLQSQPESFRAVTISESDDGGIKCYTCNEEGHKACQCRKQRKSLISHSTQKKKGGPAAHSLKSSPDKACSAFTLKHLYTTDKGKTLFRTYPSIHHNQLRCSMLITESHGYTWTKLNLISSIPQCSNAWRWVGVSNCHHALLHIMVASQYPLANLPIYYFNFIIILIKWMFSIILCLLQYVLSMSLSSRTFLFVLIFHIY